MKRISPKILSNIYKTNAYDFSFILKNNDSIRFPRYMAKYNLHLKLDLEVTVIFYK